MAFVEGMSGDMAQSGDGGNTFRVGSRMLLGVVFMGLLVGGFGGWAAVAKLSGAVISSGVVAVDQNVKAIQHRDGGIISEILIREGDTLAEGQVMFRLDDAQTRAELSILSSQLVELALRRARLMAERDNLTDFALPADLDAVSPQVIEVLNGESRIFDGNRQHRDSQKQQLQLGIDQIGEELNGLTAQHVAKAHEIELVGTEADSIHALMKKGLTERSRAYTIDRELVRLQGELGEIESSLARAKARIGEVRLQILAIDETARTDAQRELAQVETRRSELSDRMSATTDRLSRTDIRAPITGRVNELNVHTIGGVISPAQVLATIVPKDAKLNITMRISPSSIDQVQVDQPARIRFPTFNQRTTPELKGHISFVSPATSRDEATGALFYLGYVDIPDAELARLEGQQLLPGMPVEVFAMTEERSVLSYLLKPLSDRFSRAFRER
jgi:HlyD family type I secretion membrane fusion protein